MIKLQNISKIFDSKSKVTALSGINLTIGRGEMVAVMGPSGSGKSTLLNLMGGLDIPTEGQVLVDGVDLALKNEKERSLFRRSHISYIFQAYHLMPTLRVWQNIALPLHLAGISGSLISSKVDQVLVEVGLEARANHLPDELSGGERQRTAIARALVTDAPLMLADEPTGNLDTARGGEILALLRRIHQERGTTIIMVTHDHHAASTCERLITLRDGSVEGDVPVVGSLQ